ncbi:hypothetical protein C8J55DRAFT_103154 [Lentinula edodes]|uniref:TEA domain-containing protein n=1 Tax=Lentinula lateritia TaxID=40482 RepID=A0A9W9B017_9AGAR|nr:hypothetical protein C8J55DRAFT_103154 [Lentinula edodes]
MPSRPGKSQKPHADYISMSTVEDLSYTPSVQERTRDAAQIMATGRRSWKTLKGRGEAVWPPHLEAALIEALEKYKPDDPRSSKSSGRFSMRNRFISDYIFESTGKQRTPKQVGSRLQQLRDTCKSEKILQLISRRNIEDDPDSGVHIYTQSPSASPPPENNLIQNQSSSRLSKTIWVSVVLERLSWSSPSPVINLVNNEKVIPQVIHLTPKTSLNASSSSYSSVDMGLLSHLEPLVTLASPYKLERQCSFSLFLDGSGLPMHSESAYMTEHSHTQSSDIMYSGRLIPGFWRSLCESTAPTRFTIVQNLCFTPRSPIDLTNVSIIYNFTHPVPNTEFSLPAMSAYDSALDFSLMNTHSSSFAPGRNWDQGITERIGNSPGSYSYSPALFNPGSTGRYDISTTPRNDRGSTASWVYGQRYP